MSRLVFLVPGFFGFTSVGAVSYFERVEQALDAALRRRGAEARIVRCRTQPTASICTPRADPAQASEFVAPASRATRGWIVIERSHSPVRPARPAAVIGHGGEQRVFWGCQRSQGLRAARRARLDPDG
jgi:hypothetical protein